jgi:glycosyltransferase involved in cell wall biosynthesis
MKTIVFHINVFLSGGIEKVLLELLQALDPAKYRLKLSIGHNMGDLEVLKDRIPAYVSVHYILDKPIFNNYKIKKTLRTISLPEKLFFEAVLPPFKKQVHKKRIKKIVSDADVVIDFDTTLAGYYKLLEGKKTLAYSHFSLQHYWTTGNARKRDRLARRLAHYDTIITICDEMKEDAAKLYPELAHKMVRLYNSLDFDKIKEAAQEPLDNDPAIPKDFIISAGRLIETQKDFTTVIKAYAAYVKQYGGQEALVIAGKGPDMEKMQALAKQEGVADKVYFIGFQTNPYKWINRAKLFLFGSKHEGLPTVLIEAIALQKPVVATECKTGVKEILMYGDAGTLVPVSDVATMAKAVHTLINDTNMQQRYLINAAQIIKEFDIKTVLGQFEQLL